MTNEEFDNLVDNRKFMREQIAKAAANGNSICGSLLSLEALANQTVHGSFVANELIDLDDDDSDFDDIF